MTATPLPHATCVNIQVPAEACYLRFSSAAFARADDHGNTARDEMMILDYDSEERVIGIELVGAGKPCQDGSGSCIEIQVPPEVCYIRFSSAEVARAAENGYTVRGELMIFRHDSKGDVVGIELVAPGKPCQER